MKTDQPININDCAAILGVDKYQSRDDIMRKMVRMHFNKEPEFTENFATQYAKISKKTALYQYQIETENEVFTTGTQRKGIFYANPDGLIENGIIKIHCPFALRDEKEPKFETINNEQNSAIQMQLYCTDRYYCDFVVWNQHFMKIRRIVKNDVWAANHLKTLNKFYDDFLQEIDKSRDHLEEKYFRPKIMEIDTKETKKLLEEYDLLNIEEDSIKNRKRLIIEELSGLSDGRDLLVCGRKLTHIERAGSIRYAELVKQQLPDIDLSEFRNEPSSFWKLT